MANPEIEVWQMMSTVFLCKPGQERLIFTLSGTIWPTMLMDLSKQTTPHLGMHNMVTKLYYNMLLYIILTVTITKRQNLFMVTFT